MKILYYVAGFIIATAIYGLIIFVVFQLGYQPRGFGWVIGWVALMGVARNKVRSIVEGLSEEDQADFENKE